MKQPLVSIVVPVHSVEPYLRECMDSLIKQTLKNIEIILVNDCSPLDEESIILEYSAKDARIVYIKHEKNKGILEARRTAVEAAQGEYLLFVDGDDYLPRSASARLYRRAMQTGADIIQFPFIEFQQDRRSKQDNYIRKTLRGREVFEELFVNHTFLSWSNGGKMIRRSLFAQALAEIPTFSGLLWREDYLLTFIVAYYAQCYTYCGSTFYAYRKEISGAAASRKAPITQWLSNYQSLFQIYRCFCDKIQLSTQYPLVKNQNFLLYLIAKRFITNYSSAEPKYFADLSAACGEAELFDALYKAIPLECLAPHVLVKDTRPIKIQTIGIVVNKMWLGGVERVVSKQLEIFQELGYAIVLFTETPPHPKDFPVNKKVIRYELDTKAPFYFIHQKIKEHNISLIVTQDHWTKFQQYLLMYCATVGIPSIQYHHSMPFTSCYTAYINYGSNSLLQDRAAHIFSTAFICLSRMDQIYFQNAYLLPAVYMPNPLTFNPDECPQAPLKEKNILFIGRLSILKNPMLLLDAFPQVLKTVPDATLTICGEGELEQELHKKACAYGIEASVTFAGNVSNIDVYLQKASVHVVCSLFEGFSMAWGEAKAHGVPTVYTKMEYLEMARLGGSLGVEQDNAQALADALVKLLTDDKLRKKMGQEEKESLKKYNNSTLALRWQQLFTDISTGTFSQSSLLLPDPSLDKDDVMKFYHAERLRIAARFAHIPYPRLSAFSFKVKLKQGLICFIKKIALSLFPPQSGRRRLLKNIIWRFKNSLFS